jgi:hypothetical protein
VTPTVVGIGVALAGAVVVWLVACIPRLHPVIGDVDRTPAEAESEAEAIVAAAEAKAAQIVAAAETVFGEARETAGRAAAEIRTDAKRTARRIIKEAEARGLELVETAETQRVQAERAAVRAQEFADRSLGEFAELVQALLVRVDREFVTSATNGRAPVEREGVPRSKTA